MKSKPGRCRFVVFITAGMAFAVGSCASASTDPLNSPAGTSTTIIIIRHAERDPGEFVPLNEEGFRRRDALTSALAENGVTAIYCTDTLRNRQTVEPLAEMFDLEINVVSPLGFFDTALVADNLVQTFLTQHFGGTILYCGNTGSGLPIGTVGINAAIYQRLGGTGRPPERYQDMYIAVVPEEGPTRFVKTEYGGRSSLD